MASRQKGRTIERSIHDAKDVTVNFNQRGTQVPQFSMIYMFIGANVQAIYKLLQATGRHPFKMTGVMTAYAALGAYILPALAHLLGGDDGEEEYWKLSDNDRHTKYCILLGFKPRLDEHGNEVKDKYGKTEMVGNWWKIPSPQTFRPFQKIGDVARQWMDGRMPAGDAMLNATGALLDLLTPPPFNQTTPSVQEWREKGIYPGLGMLLSTVAPQAVRPVAELVINKDYAGNPIRDEWKDTGKGQYLPDWTKVRTNRRGDPYTPQVLIDMMKGISDFTGGDETDGGFIDWNPDNVNHFLRGYLGGTYSTIIRSIDAIERLVDGNPDNNPTARDIPVASSFLSSTDDSPVIPRQLANRYFNGLKELTEYHDRYVNATQALGTIPVNGKDVPLYDVYMDRERYPLTHLRMTDEQKRSVEKLNAKLEREARLKTYYDMLESEKYKGTFKLKKDGAPYANLARNQDGIKHRIEQLKEAIKDPSVSAKEKREKELELANEYASFLMWYLRLQKK
jgi:hypothetical protein